mgnify:CR=1 FL=1
MSSFQQPPISPYFLAHAWHLADHKELREELQKAIFDDPEIESKGNISVNLETEGSKITEIHLLGSVGSDREKQRAEEIMSVNTKNEVKIVNELAVS